MSNTQPLLSKDNLKQLIGQKLQELQGKLNEFDRGVNNSQE